MKAEYTKEEKIAYYWEKLQVALATGAAAKTVFEAMFYAERASWFTQRLMKILISSEDSSEE